MNPSSNHIDINCDLGEGITAQDCDNDRLLMQYISSCNIACGGHAGNNLTIELSVKNAIASEMNVGAHPGYPDKTNFGRKTMRLARKSLENSIRAQIDSLQNEVHKQSIKLAHIKFHGALYNDIENDLSLANRMAKLCKTNYPKLKLLGLANGHLKTACKEYSLGFISEGFMDRVYLSSGKLTPRTQQNAVIHEPAVAIQQAIALVKKEPLLTSDGGDLRIKVDSICLHGDNPQAPIIAKSLVAAFNKEGFKISGETNR